ncbi:MAG: aromatic ring-hydroxylating dioxygenase subunit alpha [Candidatus Nanopelagicales bacterium]
MLKNFWYALEFSSRVTPAAPTPARILLQDLVLERDASGRVSAYNVARTGDEVLPVVERYGFVWVFMGDGTVPVEAAPPIPVWPEWDDPRYGGHEVKGDWLWKANVNRVVENGCDAAHTPFVHAGQFGNPKMPEIPDYEVEVPNEWEARLSVELHPPAPKGLFALRNKARKSLEERPPVLTRTGWQLPSLIRLEVNLSIGQMVLYDTNIPIDETTTLTKWVSLRTFFTGKWADKNAAKRVPPIFIADAEIVENQRPELLPFDLSAELHVKSDAIAVNYRRRLAELNAQGYRYDGELLTGFRPELVARSMAEISA